MASRYLESTVSDQDSLSGDSFGEDQSRITSTQIHVVNPLNKKQETSEEENEKSEVPK